MDFYDYWKTMLLIPAHKILLFRFRDGIFAEKLCLKYYEIVLTVILEPYFSVWPDGL